MSGECIYMYIIYIYTYIYILYIYIFSLVDRWEYPLRCNGSSKSIAGCHRAEVNVHYFYLCPSSRDYCLTLWVSIRDYVFC